MNEQLEVEVNANGAIQVRRVGGLAVAEIWLRGDRERELKMARLLAAAPDLFEALQELLLAWDDKSDPLAGVAEDARAAISKATA